jgi:hypothetical protein
MPRHAPSAPCPPQPSPVFVCSLLSLSTPPPRTLTPPDPRALVAVCAGGATQALVSANVARLLGATAGPVVDVMLFVYDTSDWREEPWASHPGVVTVRAAGQMKWWYFKRFLAPDVVAAYQWVLLLDDDVDLAATDFSLGTMTATMAAAGLRLAQPAHAPGSETTFGLLHQVQPHLTLPPRLPHPTRPCSAARSAHSACCVRACVCVCTVPARRRSMRRRPPGPTPGCWPAAPTLWSAARWWWRTPGRGAACGSCCSRTLSRAMVRSDCSAALRCWVVGAATAPGVGWGGVGWRASFSAVAVVRCEPSSTIFLVLRHSPSSRALRSDPSRVHCVLWLCASVAAGRAGYDLVWGPLCAPDATGVVDIQTIAHMNLKVGSQRVCPSGCNVCC